MEFGHVIYKVENLEIAVNECTKLGFRVEYGRKKKSYNALIYFSEGAYIELLASTGMPGIIKKLFLIMKKKFIKRIIKWDANPNGFCDACFEGTEQELEQIATKLNNEGFLFSTRRIDCQNRELNYRLFFPNDLTYPFFMSHFSSNPKPKNFVHPNGVKKISQATLYANEKVTKFLREQIHGDTNINFVTDATKCQLIFDNGLLLTNNGLMNRQE